MAPEIFQDEGVHSYYSDMWSFGCILYELATGKPPFYSDSFKALVNMIQYDPVPVLDGFTDAFNDLLSKLLEKEPTCRPSWDELAGHQFWSDDPFTTVPMPDQPQFDRYLISKGITPEHFYAQRSNPLAKKLIRESAKVDKTKQIDIIRLSQNVKSNMRQVDNYDQPEDPSSDIKLKNRDVELNFGKRESTPSKDEMLDPSPHKLDTEEELLEEEKIGYAKEEFKSKRGLKGDPLSESLTSKSSVSRKLKTETDFGKRDSLTGDEVEKSENLFTNNRKIGNKTVEQLLIHNIDTSVKPIIGNKDIEKQNELRYSLQFLTFNPWKIEDIVETINTNKIENHLSEVYSSIAGNSPQEKIHALAYFESIIVNSNVANRLINSAFVNLFVKVLKSAKSTQIKQRLCSIIGLLVRHATIIENDRAELGICEALMEHVNDKNDKVRRKSMAALGEFLFYAATQLDDEQADPIWEISDDAINCVVAILGEEKDSVVKFYACKTIENITAQSISAGERFATPEAASSLLNIYLNSESEGFRIVASVGLSHLSKLNPSLFPVIFETITPKAFFGVFKEGHARTQQAYITMLNLALRMPYQKLLDTLLSEENFLPSLMCLLEHQSTIIRGKTLLTFILLFKLDFRWMSIAHQELKFFNFLDRVQRESNKYFQSCLFCLVDTVLEIVSVIFKTVKDACIKIVKKGDTDFDKDHRASKFDDILKRQEFQELSGDLTHIVIILDLMNSQIFKSRIISLEFISTLSKLLELTEGTNFTGSDEFLNVILLIIECLSSVHKCLFEGHEPILQYLLPRLLSLLDHKSTNFRFLSLKIFADITTQYLSDTSIYDVSGGNTFSKGLNKLILKKLFPKYAGILEDQDPVPLFGLKLLSIIVERNSAFITILADLNLISVICDYFEDGHQRLNRYTIKIIKNIVESDTLEVDDINELKIAEKANSIIVSMLKKKQDWCFELLLDIIYYLLKDTADKVQSQNEESSACNKLIDILYKNFIPCIKLLSLEFESIIVDRASQCLLTLLQLYAINSDSKKKQIYFIEEHMEYLLGSLD
jgi:serine/threonine-protein kinase ULK4